MVLTTGSMSQLVVQRKHRHESRTRRVIVSCTAPALVALLTMAVPQPAGAYSPGLPSKTTAQSELDALTVRAEGASTPYDRDLFPHWVTVNGCTTRETAPAPVQHPSDAQTLRSLKSPERLMRTWDSAA